MTSIRFYLVDALIRWLLDNDCVPHIVLQCDLPNVNVPQEFVNDNQLVLSVAPQAVQNFSLTKSIITFDTRFQGVSHRIAAPVGSIIGVYARGSSVGMMFDPEEATSSVESNIEPIDLRARSKAKFKVVE